MVDNQVNPPGNAEEVAPQRKNSWRNWRAAILSALLVAVFVWVLARGGLPMLPPKGSMARLKMLPFVAFCAGMVFNMLTRFARCQFLVAPVAKVPFRRIMTINAIGMALITYLPLRLGEWSRPAMLREKGHLSAWAVTGMVAAERILDGVAFSGMLLLGLALATPQSPLPDHVGALPVPVSLVPASARIAALVFAVAFLMMGFFYRFRALARRLTERIIGVVSPRWGTRIADIIERLSDGLRFLTHWRHSLPYLLVTIVCIASQVWALDQLADAVGLPELTFAQTMVVIGVMALGFTAPNTPGFFGVIQLSLYCGLATYIAPAKVANEGAAFVFLFYVVYLLNVTLLAAIALVIEAFVARRESAGSVLVRG
jgi:glycosyltransferase 2 family protein